MASRKGLSDQRLIWLGGLGLILPSKGMPNAFSADFHLAAHSASASGIERPGDKVEALQSGRVVSEVTPGSDGASVAGAIDSIALVEQTTRRNSTVVVKQRHELGPGVSHRPAIAGYCLPHLARARRTAPGGGV